MRSLTRAAVWKPVFLLVALSAAVPLVHGYHLGVEDQAIYLPGIEQKIHPNLFAADAELFLPQTRPTLLVPLVAWSVRTTGMPLDVTVFIWHFLSIFALLFAAWRLACRCFALEEARWCAVALLAALFTMPVAGTSIFIVDTYLHPRTLATALILLAIVDVLDSAVLGFKKLDRHIARAILWIGLAATIHIQMALYGFLLSLFLGWKPGRKAMARVGDGEPPSAPGATTQSTTMAAAFPLQSLFQPGSEAWKEAARTRFQHYLLNWEWYEWLGAIAPLLFFWWFVKLARRSGLEMVDLISQRVAAFQVFSIVSALVLTLPPQFERLTPFQPMRALHLATLIFVLLAGGFIGQFLLRRSAIRWALLFAPLCATMFYVQRQIFPASEHIEFPGRASHNPSSRNPCSHNQWVQAFLWAKNNTPENAYFALDTHYVELPGNDQHGFRAFSQRSMMADWNKDGGVVTLFPAIAERWQRETHARANWKNFSSADFQHLHEQFGVGWVVLEKPMKVALNCPYENAQVAVCKVAE